MQPSFIKVGQTHAEWQTFEKPETKRQKVDMLFLVMGFISLIDEIQFMLIRFFA